MAGRVWEQWGERIPSFTAATTLNPRYQIDSAAGRYMVLGFFGSAALPPVQEALAVLEQHAELFDGERAVFFGVSVDGNDLALERVRDRLPGMRFVWDFDGAVSVTYGAMRPGSAEYRPFWLLVDPTLRVLDGGALAAVPELIERLKALPPVDRHAGHAVPAPVLVAPRIFEPELCQRLIGWYERVGGLDSGFMREIDGRTVGVFDHALKHRADCDITDPELMEATRTRIVRRLLPEVLKAFQFKATRMERYIVACYEGDHGGHFKAHRDNTTQGTAHRRFAVTINLNAEDYDGGELRFPEFGSTSYRAPTGGAVVFSCSLLHEALPVVGGRRYAFLPFLYGEADAQVRQANQKLIVPGVRDSDGEPAGTR